MRPLHIIFRCNASNEIGYGHLFRCTALAKRIQYLQPQSLISFVVNQEASWQNPHILSCFDVHICNATPCAEDITHLNPDAVVLDGYSFSTELEEILANQCELLRIDDGQLCQRHSYAHIILNSGPGFHASDYSQSHKELWIGPAYHPLKMELQNPATYTQPKDDKTILIMGGSDPLALTEPLIRRLWCDFSLRVICGPGVAASEQQKITALCQQHKIEYHNDPKNLPALMAGSKQAITAAGSTVYELAALGIPMAAVKIADNQAPLVDWLRQQNIPVFNPSELQSSYIKSARFTFRRVELRPASKINAALTQWLQRLLLRSSR